MSPPPHAPARAVQQPRVRAARNTRHMLIVLVALMDTLCVGLGPMVAGALVLHQTSIAMKVVGGLMAVFLTLSFLRKSYLAGQLQHWGDSVRQPIGTLALTYMLAIGAAYFFERVPDITATAVAIGASVSVVGIMVVHGLAAGFINRRLRDTLFDVLYLVDGGELPLRPAARVFQARSLGLRPDLNDPQMLGRFALIARPFDRVVVASSPEREAAWATMLKAAGVVGEIVMTGGNALGVVGTSSFAGRDTLVVARGALSLSDRLKKRTLDLAVTVPLLMLLAPLLILVALIIRLESKGPVLFKQPRVGQGNQLFDILKFRSMKAETLDHAGARSTSRDDDRITRFGRFIRKTSIDELPQLINVLRGEMSVVGPRPHALGSRAGDQLFWEVNQRYWLRHALKPGMTGLAQIRGFRGATDRREDLEGRLQADLEYVARWSVWGDISIIIRTVGVLVHPNAY